MAAPIHPAPRRLLIRGVNWLGDAVMTTPALLRLRELFPQTHIALLTPEKLADLWTDHPALDEVIAFKPKDGLLGAVRKIRAGKFDFALVLPNSPRSALETWLAGIPRRIGYARPWRNELLTDPIPARPGTVAMEKRSERDIFALIATDATPPAPPPIPASAHQMHEYLHLAAVLGANPNPLAPRLAVSPAELAAVRIKFALPEEPALLAGLNPGAEYGPAKRWPAHQFITTAKAVRAKKPVTWIVFGGKSDMVTAGQIEESLLAAEMPVLNLAGRTTLRELMAVLKHCQVLLTNDTGPMHVAAALGTPVVVPFGSTSPELTGPGLPGDPHLRLLRSGAPCAPCFLRECPIDFRCMNGITPDRVVKAVLESLPR